MSFDQDPLSQFLRCTTRVMHVTVGLDWYSFEKPVLAKKLEPAYEAYRDQLGVMLNWNQNAVNKLAGLD